MQWVRDNARLAVHYTIVMHDMEAKIHPMQRENVCVCVCVCVYIYIYIYIYTHKQKAVWVVHVHVFFFFYMTKVSDTRQDI